MVVHTSWYIAELNNSKFHFGLLIVEDLAINLSLNSVHQSILEQF